MHLIKLVMLGWISFGVLTMLGFLWLCERSVRALDQPVKKQPAFDHRVKSAAAASSKLA
jgi:hypothetical protein